MEGRGHLDDHARRTIEAAMARVIPTDDTPGAREAGTIDWLDGYLSGERVWAKPDGSGFIELKGKNAAAWEQRIAALRGRYREGVVALDEVAEERFGDARFVDLGEDDQDAVLSELERRGALVRERTQASVLEDDLPFFALLALHTRQAFYSDPVYGGNRDQVGWQLIGFHGPKDMAEALTDAYTTDAYLA
jgi:gluconate 2-dehydrogenase gamma chain